MTVSAITVTNEDGSPSDIKVTYKSALVQRLELELELRGYEHAVTTKMKRQLNMGGSRLIDFPLSVRVRQDGNAWLEDRTALVRRVIGSAGALNRMMKTAA